MKKLLLVLLLLFFPTQVFAASTEMLSAPWTLTQTNGPAEKYQVIPANSLQGKQSLTLIYNLHGNCILGGDASAIIWDQNNAWHYISLSSYGTNCLNGNQTVTIPLSAFPGLDTTQNVGQFHVRFWKTGTWTIDISSAKLNSLQTTPTVTPTSIVTTTPSPTVIPSSTPTPTPTPIQNLSWAIRSIDVMKYSKDVVCNPPSQATIDIMVQKVVDLGGNYVSISTPYDNPSCGNSLTLTTMWVNSIRAHGLHVWHRHMKLSFEGIYNVTKSSNDDSLQTMSDYIINNPTLFADGDMFTPSPEPDSAGINGVSYCASTCQFSSKEDFNQWIRNAQTVAKLSFAQIGLKDKIKIGYYGTSGFIVFGENNTDWFGKSFLEQRTVDSMGGVIAMDSYPESYGGTMAPALDEAHVVWPHATIVIGEWGTTTAGTSAQATTQINNTMQAAKRSYVTGFNYWNLGPSGNEGLLNNDLTNKSQFTDVKTNFNN